MTSEVYQEYVSLLNHVAHSLDALIYELETQAIHNAALRAESLELAMDSVPVLRNLKEARKQVQISLDIYEV